MPSASAMIEADGPLTRLEVALSDLPVLLLARLDLGRPMLNHRDERRPACEGMNSGFDRGNHRQGRGHGIKPPEDAAATAQRFCAGCPILDECRSYADEHREEGLWAGEYRVRLYDRGTAKGYRRFPLLEPAEPLAPAAS